MRRPPVKTRRVVLPTFCALAAGLALPAAAAAPTTGKFVFTFTVSISSTLPKNAAVVCTAYASVSESGGQSITQAATGIATPSGGKATCTAIMPYYWELVTPSADKIVLSYHVEVDYGVEITAANGTGTLVQLASSDKVTENLGSRSVPADGTTTDEAVSAIL
jgi:hypothetical protein